MAVGFGFKHGTGEANSIDTHFLASNSNVIAKDGWIQSPAITVLVGEPRTNATTLTWDEWTYVQNIRIC
jgi:hypothetical protein